MQCFLLTFLSVVVVSCASKHVEDNIWTQATSKASKLMHLRSSPTKLASYIFTEVATVPKGSDVTYANVKFTACHPPKDGATYSVMSFPANLCTKLDSNNAADCNGVPCGSSGLIVTEDKKFLTGISYNFVGETCEGDSFNPSPYPTFPKKCSADNEVIYSVTHDPYTPTESVIFAYYMDQQCSVPSMLVGYPKSVCLNIDGDDSKDVQISKNGETYTTYSSTDGSCEGEENIVNHMFGSDVLGGDAYEAGSCVYGMKVWFEKHTKGSLRKD